MPDLDTIYLERPFTYNYEPIGLKCPYCGIIEIVDDKIPDQCEHIVFYYDWTNGEYTDIRPDFLKFTKRLLAHKKECEVLDEDLKETIDRFLEEGVFPHPNDLQDLIQYLKLYEMYTVDGGHGTMWGHASKRLLNKINKNHLKD